MCLVRQVFGGEFHARLVQQHLVAGVFVVQAALQRSVRHGQTAGNIFAPGLTLVQLAHDFLDHLHAQRRVFQRIQTLRHHRFVHLEQLDILRRDFQRKIAGG